MHALRLLIAAFLVLMNHPVNAELITASFGGTVTLIIDNGSILHPTVQLGSRVSGAFTFESTAQGAPVTDGKTYLAGSNFGPVYFWMSTEVYSFHSPSLQIDVANNALPHQNPFGPREDRYRVGCWSGIQSISGLNVEHMALEFSTTETATLADTSLPLSAWSLAGFDQALIVFCSRNRHALKLLTYDGQGFWLFQKRLSRGRFTWWPDTKETSRLRLDPHQLQMLLWNGNPSRTQAAPMWRPLSVTLPRRSKHKDSNGHHLDSCGQNSTQTASSGDGEGTRLDSITRQFFSRV